uniref:Uncharacterized protein n=1 Tax=Trichuris muris TaxID=70415 RepID=A0A5S6R2M2_TRIMR
MEKIYFQKGTVAHDGQKRSFQVILDPSSARSVLGPPPGLAFREGPSTQRIHSGARQINLIHRGWFHCGRPGVGAFSLTDHPDLDNVPPPGMVGKGEGSDTRPATVEPAPMDLD